MTRSRVAALEQTPKKNAKRKSNDKNADGSPEKQGCLLTPATKLAKGLEQLDFDTPSRRSTRNLKNQTLASILTPKNTRKSPARNFLTDLKDQFETEQTPARCTRSRSKSPARKSPARHAKQALKFDVSPDARFEVEDGDMNMEAEDEYSENLPPSPRRTKSARRLPVDRRNEDDETPKEPPKTPIKPIRLKKVPVVERNTPIYRVSDTPKTPANRRVETRPSTSRATRNTKKMLEIDSDEEVYSEDEESEEEEVIVTKRRGRAVRKEDALPATTPLKANRKKKKAETLEDLRSLLHTSEVPESMPCREEDYKRIRQFVLEAIKPNANSQAMYISGVPGTGKTATTQAVINELKKKHDFHFVAVNAMELIEPKQLFVEVYKEIVSEKRVSAAVARKKLNAMFELVDKKRKPVVMLVDELDMLCTKRQEILYDIFNWTSSEGARVSVIAIANTLDLPERMLSQRITSRLGSNRILFQPYTHEQIKDIICARLSNAPDVVGKDAIELAARKVANVTGDLRKAMDILRRAIEIAVEKGDKHLTCEHVNAANREATSVPRVAIVEALSRHAFILLRAAVSQVQSSGVEEFMFYELYRQYRVLCTQLEGIEPFHDYGIHHMLMELCSNRLLVAAPGVNFPRRKIRLGMTTQEAQFAIKQADEALKSGKIKYTL